MIYGALLPLLATLAYAQGQSPQSSGSAKATVSVATSAGVAPAPGSSSTSYSGLPETASLGPQGYQIPLVLSPSSLFWGSVLFPRVLTWVPRGIDFVGRPVIVDAPKEAREQVGQTTDAVPPRHPKARTDPPQAWSPSLMTRSTAISDGFLHSRLCATHPRRFSIFGAIRPPSGDHEAFRVVAGYDAI